MLDAIAHRGPDSRGHSMRPCASVGFVRLAIIDLQHGTQPVSNEDGTIECFLNGEIFNHAELRQELESRGHRMPSRSDAEVLPHLYEEHGDALFEMLNGMFAVCVIDHRKDEVLVARDHFGVKQMYLTETDLGTIFASEMKGLIASDLFEPRLDASAVPAYLSMFYCPEPRTLVEGVRKLAPATFVRIRAGRVVEEHRFHRVPTAPDPWTGSDQEAVAETRRLLEQSVSRQLQADVPVGISLSGGLDSTALAYAASRAGGTQPIAITIGWQGFSEEEVACAKEVCERLGLEHEVLEPSFNDVVDDLVELAWVSDEPIADPALYSQYCVSKAASKSVTVLLSGAGGDELFGGYTSYMPGLRNRMYISMPRPMQRLVEHAGIGHWFGGPLLRCMEAFPDSRCLWHCERMSSLWEPERALLADACVGSLDPFVNIESLFGEYDAYEPVNQQMITDLYTYLPDQILPMLDRATMAASIEGRVPLLDKDLVGFAMRLSGSTKMGSPPIAKKILKEAVRDGIPDSVIDRRKAGMPSPAHGLVQREHDGLLRHALLGPDSVIPTVVPRPWVESLLANQAVAVTNFRVIYAMLLLEIWHRLMIRERQTTRPSMSLRDLLQTPSGDRLSEPLAAGGLGRA